MKYEKPEMEVLNFGNNISTLDIVGGASNQDYDNSDTGGNEW